MQNLRLFSTLFNKYLDNRCSREETEYLLGLIQSEEYKRLANEMIESRLKSHREIVDGDDEIREKLNTRLRFILSESPGEVALPGRKLFSWKWVAAASILLVFSYSTYWLSSENAPSEEVPVESKSFAAALSGYTRYITLPDGSSVILHAGSKLDYPTTFTGKMREVMLSGEAYFDVAHNPAHPFVIHTGKIKTTVLGTAFNIKSDEKQVTVSVTRGKVRVEDGNKVLAVLTPDQQVQYDVKEEASAQHTVNASNIVTDWTRENMIFNGITFEEIAGLLSLRYGVAIKFQDEALKKCKIRASFSGTETLEHVASVLSAIRNGSFEQQADGTIVFRGDGCE